MANDDKITIPFPRPTQNVFRGYKDRAMPPKKLPRSVRMSDEDYFKIERAANSIQMSWGEFVRWAALYSSIEVENELLRRSFLKDKEVQAAKVDLTGFK